MVKLQYHVGANDRRQTSHLFVAVVASFSASIAAP